MLGIPALPPAASPSHLCPAPFLVTLATELKAHDTSMCQGAVCDTTRVRNNGLNQSLGEVEERGKGKKKVWTLINNNIILLVNFDNIPH